MVESIFSLRILLDPVHGLPRERLDDVDVAGLERRDAQVLVRIGHEPDLRRPGLAGAVILGKALERDRHAALAGLEDVRAGADGLVGIGVAGDLGQDRRVIAGKKMRKRRARRLQDDAHGSRIENLDALNDVEIGAQERRPFRVLDQADRELHVLRRYRRAIVEFGVAAELEDVRGRAVRRPALGQLGLQVALRIVGQKRAVHAELHRS